MRTLSVAAMFICMGVGAEKILVKDGVWVGEGLSHETMPGYPKN